MDAESSNRGSGVGGCSGEMSLPLTAPTAWLARRRRFAPITVTGGARVDLLIKELLDTHLVLTDVGGTAIAVSVKRPGCDRQPPRTSSTASGLPVLRW